MRRHHREATESHESVDLDRFAREILSSIEDLPLRQLRGATGLSLMYLSLIRGGERVPHPRHWPAFQTAVSPTDG
jgi:hypothetical protein